MESLISEHLQVLTPIQINRFVELMELLMVCTVTAPMLGLELADSLLQAISMQPPQEDELSEEELQELHLLVSSHESLSFMKENRVSSLQTITISAIRQHFGTHIPRKVHQLRSIIPPAIEEIILNEQLFHVAGPLGLETALEVPHSSIVDDT